MTSRYKIIIHSHEDYYGKVFTEYKTVNFSELCSIKNIDTKKLYRRVKTYHSTVREAFNIPCKEFVRDLFGKSDYSQLFNEDGEGIVSSQYATVNYLLRIGFEPEKYGFNSKLFKAAA